MRLLILLTGIIVFLSLLNTNFAHAGVFVEPGVTYEKGDGELDFPDPFGGTSADVDGFGVMARVGFDFGNMLWVGADGRYSRPELDNEDYKADATSWNYGPTAGLQMPTPLGLRVWGTWVLDGKLDPEEEDQLDVRFEKARGYRVGVGVKLAIVSVNLEYQQLKYDKAVLEEIGPFNPGTEFDDVDGTNDSWILSASFPIGL